METNDTNLVESAKYWANLPFSTAPVDFDAAEAVLLRMFKLCKLTPPVIILRMGSPTACGIGVRYAQQILMAHTVLNPVLGSAFDTFRKKIWSTIETDAQKSFDRNVLKLIETTYKKAADERPSNNYKTESNQVMAESVDSILNDVEDQIGAYDPEIARKLSSMYAKLRARTAEFASASTRYPAYEGPSCFKFEALRDLYKWKSASAELVELDSILARSCYSVTMFGRVAAIGARPTHAEFDANNRLHCETGPSIEFGDGSKSYHFHGMRVSRQQIANLHNLTPQIIEAERNAEIRRVYLARYGTAKFVQETGATVVDSLPADHALKGMRTANLLVKDVIDDEPIVYVDVLNSTPEPDGTTRRYMMRIDPRAYGGDARRSVHAALASTWRNANNTLAFADWRDYYPVHES